MDGTNITKLDFHTNIINIFDGDAFWIMDRIILYYHTCWLAGNVK